MSPPCEITKALEKFTAAKAMLIIAKKNYTEAQQELKMAQTKHCRQKARIRATQALRAFRQNIKTKSTATSVPEVEPHQSPQIDRPDTVLSIGSFDDSMEYEEFLEPPVSPTTTLPSLTKSSTQAEAKFNGVYRDPYSPPNIEKYDPVNPSFKFSAPKTATAIVKQPENSVKRVSLPEIHMPNTPEYNRIIQTKLMGQEAAKVELKNFRTGKHHSFPRNLPEIKLFNTVADVVQYFKNTSRCTPDLPNSFMRRLKLAHYEHFDNIFPRAQRKIQKDALARALLEVFQTSKFYKRQAKFDLLPQSKNPTPPRRPLLGQTFEQFQLEQFKAHRAQFYEEKFTKEFYQRGGHRDFN